MAVVSQICDAMRKVSAAGIVHRDLSAHNILVHRLNPLTVKVIDFGLAMRGASARESVVFSMGAVGDIFSVRWTAAEIFQCRPGQLPPWSEFSDVWSFGVTAWQVWAHGEVPYTLAMTDQAVINHVTKGRCLSMPFGCEIEIFKDVIETCWSSIPERRPTFEQLWARLLKLHPKYMNVA